MLQKERFSFFTSDLNKKYYGFSPAKTANSIITGMGNWLPSSTIRRTLLINLLSPKPCFTKNIMRLNQPILRQGFYFILAMKYPATPLGDTIIPDPVPYLIPRHLLKVFNHSLEPTNNPLLTYPYFLPAII